MNSLRRGILGLSIVAMAAAAALGCARAEEFPARPIKVIVPFPAGGVLDTITRAIGDRARAKLGQTFVLENKAGAGGAIGLQACAMSPPDGYTLCAVTAEAVSVTPHFDPALYERYKTLVPVTELVTAPGVIYANADVKVRDLKSMLALAKRDPKALSYSSWGPGTSANLLFEWLKKTNGVDILHVPHKGSRDALQAVLGGQVQVSYVALGLALPHIKAGKLTALAVLGDDRLPLLPDVPSLGELGIDFPYKNAWFGLMAPAGTPLALREKIAAAVKEAVHDPELGKKFFANQGYKPVGSTPQEMESLLKKEYQHGADIIRITGIKKAP